MQVVFYEEKSLKKVLFGLASESTKGKYEFPSKLFTYFYVTYELMNESFFI